MVNGRVSSVPTRFGNVLPSYFSVYAFFASSTVYVPKLATLPCTTALFSSGVPCARFCVANFGSAERTICDEKYPFSVKISSPFGLVPHAGLPFEDYVVEVSNVQVTTECSFMYL